VKSSPAALFGVGAINRPPPTPWDVGHSAKAKNSLEINFLSSLLSS
jgi:hypothetical protein